MCGAERQYIFALVRWMSLKVGRERQLEIFHGSGIRARVPYYVYDGYEACPIVLIDQWKDKAPPRDPKDYHNPEWEMHDEFGWLVSGNFEVHTITQSGIYPEEHQRELLAELETMHDEIKRLDKLWKEQTK